MVGLRRGLGVGTWHCGYPINLPSIIQSYMFCTPTPYFLAPCVPVCGFMRASHFPDYLRCASAAVATTGGKGVGVTFLSGGGERVWSNVKIITSGGREIERED